MTNQKEPIFRFHSLPIVKTRQSISRAWTLTHTIFGQFYMLSQLLFVLTAINYTLLLSALIQEELGTWTHTHTEKYVNGCSQEETKTSNLCRTGKFRLFDLTLKDRKKIKLYQVSKESTETGTTNTPSKFQQRPLSFFFLKNGYPKAKPFPTFLIIAFAHILIVFATK